MRTPGGLRGTALGAFVLSVLAQGACSPEVPRPPVAAIRDGAAEREAVRAAPKRLACAANATCAIRSDGTVACWGEQGFEPPPPGVFVGLVAADHEVCGLGANRRAVCWRTLEAVTAHAPPPGEFLQLSASRSNVCGLLPDLRATCWGDASSGYTAVPPDRFRRLAGGGRPCGLRLDGAIVCWEKTPFASEGLGAEPFQDLVVGDPGVCGVLADGRVRCAGKGREADPVPGVRFVKVDGHSGLCGVTADGDVRCFGYGPDLAPPLSVARPFERVFTGRRAACGIRPGGAAACWGEERGDPPAGPFAEIAVCEDGSCGLRPDGTIACWGGVYQGQSQPPAGTFRQVASGRRHSCALRDDGAAACWGDAGERPPAGPFTAIGAGGSLSCGLRADGTIACWGRTLGAAGPPPGRFRALSMSEHLSCAVTVEGRVQCWDANAHGLDVSQVTEATGVAVTTQDVVVQRADGSSRCFSHRECSSSGGGLAPPCWAPVACAPSRAVELGTISADPCERREDGVVACRKLYEAPPAAKPIPGGPYAAFASGPRHACAVRRDGSLRCWGANGFGQSTPPSGAFRAVAPGGSHTCAIRDDGRLLCWGGYAGTPL